MFDLLTTESIWIKTHVAGVSYENRENYIRNLTLDSPIKLVPDFTNIHHSSAFKVIATINDEEAELGYLPYELANTTKAHIEHGNEIAQAYVHQIYYDRGEKGKCGYYPCVDIKFEIKLNNQPVTDREMPVEKIETEQGSMRIIELDQQQLQAVLKPRLTYLQEVIYYNRLKWGWVLFSDFVKYPVPPYFFTDEKSATDFWFERRNQADIFKLEEGEIIKIPEGLLHILLEKIDIDVRKDGYHYDVSLCFNRNEHIREFMRELRDLSEVDEDRAEVIMELLNENSKNDFDYGYYNNNRGREFYSSMEERFCIYENAEELEKDIEICVQAFKEYEEADEEELQNYRDYVESTVDELTIKLPRSGRIALIFYDDIGEALDGY